MTAAELTGMIKTNRGKYGFVMQDSGEPDLFVLPMDCVGFGKKIPPPGVPIKYDLGVDAQKGEPKAVNVWPVDALEASPFDEVEAALAGAASDGDVTAGNVEAGENADINLMADADADGNSVMDGESQSAAGESSGVIEAGTVTKNQGRHGFIERDNGAGLIFVLPKQCLFSGGQIPPVGTRVRFEVGTDPQKGKPLAMKVTLDGTAPRHSQVNGLASGTIARTTGKCGFITQDSGDGDLFVLPKQCIGFDCVIPPPGTRVVYTIGTDPQKGLPLAESVRPEAFGGQWGVRHGPGAYGPARPHAHAKGAGKSAGPVAAMMALPWSAPAPRLDGWVQSGFVKRNCGKYGYIVQDSGEPDIFVLPKQCIAFGGEIPPEGTRVQFGVGVDPKKGQPLAENVIPETVEPWSASPSRPASRPPSRPPSGVHVPPRRPTSLVNHTGGTQAATPEDSSNDLHTGTVASSKGTHGFIVQDNGQGDLFVLPKCCVGFDRKIPPPGTRVQYTIGTDPQKGQPLAENVHAPDDAPTSAQVDASEQAPEAPAVEVTGEVLAGEICRNHTKFGYVKQDTGAPDLFVLPKTCDGFGLKIPAVGTRVLYVIGLDPQKGQPIAEQVQPEDGTIEQAEPVALGDEQELQEPQEFQEPPELHQPREPEQVRSGVLRRNNVKFGYIQQDDGEPDLFVLPKECSAFGGNLPPVGTRVQYDIGADPKKGLPCAVNVRPEGPSEGREAGVVKRNSGRFGFIGRDSGEPDLFVLPAGCVGFGGAIPPPGTRVAFAVGVDKQKGQPLAEDVHPEVPQLQPSKRPAPVALIVPAAKRPRLGV